MMERLHKTVGFFTATFLLMFAFQSCVNDDLSDCLQEKRVYFSYKALVSYASVSSVNVIREGINPADVKRMDLYIFDENGKFVKKVSDESPVMSPEYYMVIPELESGNYRFVAWGNLEGQYSLSTDSLISGVTSIDDLQLFLNTITKKTETDSLIPLFYATHSKEDYLKVIKTDDQKFLLDMIQDTHIINVRVEGINKETLLDDNNTYRLEIIDNNERYDFKDNFVPATAFTYIQPCQKDSANMSLSSSMTIMRLAEDRNPRLRVVNIQTGLPVVEENLVGLLMLLKAQGVEIDFDHQHEFDIRFVLTDSPTTLIIYINGWKIVREYSDLNSY